MVMYVYLLLIYFYMETKCRWTQWECFVVGFAYACTLDKYTNKSPELGLCT